MQTTVKKEVRWRKDHEGIRRKVQCTIDGIDYYEIKFPASCTGCYESEDGYPVGDYPMHPKHKIAMGAGCEECRGRGWIMRREGIPFDIDAYFKAQESEVIVTPA